MIASGWQRTKKKKTGREKQSLDKICKWGANFK
jgi:hypothetical protein